VDCLVEKIIMGPIVNFDGILSQEERKKILSRLESAFACLGATIPEEIDLNGEKFNLLSEIQTLIFKKELTATENERIKKLISALQDRERFLKSVIQNDDISEEEALELSDIICGVLRAVRELRELIKQVPKPEVLDAKEELMNSVEDKKRWLKFTKKIH